MTVRRGLYGGGGNTTKQAALRRPPSFCFFCCRQPCFRRHDAQALSKYSSLLQTPSGDTHQSAKKWQVLSLSRPADPSSQHKQHRSRSEHPLKPTPKHTEVNDVLRHMEQNLGSKQRTKRMSSTIHRAPLHKALLRAQLPPHARRTFDAMKITLV